MKYEYEIDVKFKNIFKKCLLIESDNDDEALKLAKRRAETSFAPLEIVSAVINRKNPLGVCECHGAGIFIVSIEGKEHFICGVTHKECNIEDE